MAAVPGIFVGLDFLGIQLSPGGRGAGLGGGSGFSMGGKAPLLMGFLGRFIVTKSA
jgi:hypothetical protein